MLSNSAYYPARPASILSFNYSTVVAWVAISLLVAETFGGALRYYLDGIGASGLLYVPKIACLGLFAVELLRYRSSWVTWAALLLLVLSSLLAMLHGAAPDNVMFGFFVFCPLLFGMVCCDHLLHRKRLFCWVMGLCLAASLVGILLDKYTTVPWKGYSYMLNGQQLSANTSWMADEADRLAGFARVSNALSIIIAISSLYLVMFMRSRFLVLLVAAASLVGIIMTTSKAPAVAYLCTVGLMMVMSSRITSRTFIVVAVLVGLALPVISLLHSFDPSVVTSTSSLSSLYDRLVNTWPNVFKAVTGEGWSWLGTGFGMFGSSVALFPVNGPQYLIGADSSALYLWATFGVLGVLLYALQIPMFFSLSRYPDATSRALLAITFCCCLISWTTDMFEVAISNLFMGLAIGRAMSGKILGDPPPAMTADDLPEPRVRIN